MKVLVDMNLSPSWVERLARSGFETVHTRVRPHHERPGLLGKILAASGGASPSVLQIRTQDLLSDVVVSVVAKALDAHRDDIERGALLSIDEAGTRVRVLPLRGSQDLP